MSQLDMKAICLERREPRVGEKHHFFGKPCSEERKLNISKANKAKNNKGKTWVERYGPEVAERRRLENSTKMCSTNAKLMSERTSNLEKEVANLLIPVGFQSNVKIGWYVVDFVHVDSKVIVEVFGDYWHCNPIIYEPTYVNHSVKKTAEQMWAHDARRNSELEKRGYQVIVLWESELNKNGILQTLMARGILTSDDLVGTP